MNLGMGGFVDDNRCNVNCRSYEEHELLAKVTHDAQLWSDILWASGGALEHSKCSYHYLRTRFTNSGDPIFFNRQFGG